MTIIFYIVGILVAAGGAWMAWLAWSVPTLGATTEKLLSMAPGLSIVGAGLLFLALGGIMARLDRIARGGERRPSRGPALD